MPNPLDWLYPPKCICCRAVLSPDAPSGRRPLCPKCADALTRIDGPICARCGRARASEVSQSACECERHPIVLVKNRSAFLYDGVMVDVIHAFKYGRHPAHGKALGEMMADDFSRHFGSDRIDRIIPVPMYAPKARRRGYNQAELLAGALAARTGIAYDRRVLARIKDTVPQSELSAEERRTNVSGVFQSAGPVTGHLLLVDDIYTTGSTLASCATELLRAGAAEVYGYTLAAAVRDMKSAPDALERSES